MMVLIYLGNIAFLVERRCDLPDVKLILNTVVADLMHQAVKTL